MEMDMDKATEINNTGVRYFLNRQFEKAEECYREALDLNPENATALNNLGLLCHQKKQYKKAIEYFKKAIRIKEKATYHVNAGNAAACLNNMEEAESWYLKALEIDSNSVSARESLAKLYEHHNKTREAAGLWSDLIRSTGKEKFKIEYAKNLMKQEKFKEAAEILYKRVSEESSTVWYYAGICEYQLKNYGSAEEVLKRGLAIDPDDENIRHYLAVTYLARGEAEKGMNQFNKILKLNPDNYQILTEKGVILLSRNKPDEALKLFEKSLSIRPDYKKAKKYKGMARKMIEKTGEK